MLCDLAAARQPVDRAELHRQLDLLLDLRERSGPDKCADPASLPVFDPPPKTMLINGVEHDVVEVQRGKHNCALWAAGIAQDLTISAAGWALNHLVGSAVAPDEIAPDSNDAERLGEELASAGNDLDPKQARAALVALLFYFALPRRLSVELREALSALEFGEVMRLLAPERSGLHGDAYTLASLRMRAVEHAHFRYGKGTRLAKAQGDIGRALGTVQPTLKSWEDRLLPSILGNETVRAKIQRAREAGKLIEEVRHDKARIEAILAYAGTAEWDLLTFAKLLEDQDISELGARYRKALTPR